ncbi:uncharacterized protein BKCO1_700050 [Diplodia corticola]|uniref:Vacuolar ATPase assembly protein VMA22 n=1 Tax=Diplodia corticola TaxID=236234 RepID=A0A1J9SCR7_9PEZI|nr:uncharacterized protein BKCO1_700050 [Diplodia corticola]OJD37365.1 hypothetical protein BKCO1_700050 [Diplodia corticola]
MAETLPTPRATPEVQDKVVADSARNSLEATLDELLKRYLLLLDQYSQARQQLSSELSSGYLSLAQANFNPSSRIRYGQDFYDERMQALRQVTTEETDSKLYRSIRLLDPPNEPTADEKKTKDTAVPTDKNKEGTEINANDDVSASVAQLSLDHEVEDESKSRQVHPGSKPGESDLGRDGEKTENFDEAQEKEGASRKPRVDDPIRWFGILVPPALRNAQGRFIQAVEGPVPKLVNVAAGMRELEIEIGRARKAIRKSAS